MNPLARIIAQTKVLAKGGYRRRQRQGRILYMHPTLPTTRNAFTAEIELRRAYSPKRTPAGLLDGCGPWGSL